MNATDSAAATPDFPSWTFNIPVDVANAGFQIAVFGQDPDTNAWKYWNPSTSAYVEFSAANAGKDTSLLIDATPSKGSYTSAVSFAVNLPSGTYLKSGVVAMFIGGSVGITVDDKGVPGSPTTTTNPDDLFSLFEFTYIASTDKIPVPTLDIDISNVDQVGFTYEVTSNGTDVPFPLANLGSSLPQKTLFDRFAASFPSGNPFNECLVYGEKPGDSTTQLRILAPQDVLEAIRAPDAPSQLIPSGAPGTNDPFAEKSYHYMVSESSETGETAPNKEGVFGGFLQSPEGKPSASEIKIGWSASAAYTPRNPTATKINIYRAEGPKANAPAANQSADIPPPTTGYTLLTSQTIDAWNKQADHAYVDNNPTSTGTQTPQSSSYGFSALSTWFDLPLQDFYAHYTSNTFVLYQFNQNNDKPAHGTLWTGKVVDVTPETGKPITALTYYDENGTPHPITTNWTYGDGKQTYKMLQLVGNAYDATNISLTSLSGNSALTKGEYQGAVLNIYFPYFTGNTGLTSITLGTGPTATVYTLPTAPEWMDNNTNGPSQMVFGCAGVFATPNDPEAIAQNSFPVLATNALTNIENVIVSALNRGIATGYEFAVKPQQYTCLFGLSEAPTVVAKTKAIPEGTYTYYLSGTLNDGSESVPSWGQTVTLTDASEVTLEWKPQDPSIYTQANVYRQDGSGDILLVGTVANTKAELAKTFTDANQFKDENSPITQPTNGAPFVYYPSWSTPSHSGYVASNLFSAFLHQNLSADPTTGISINGLCYGYPFDDQGNFSTNINYASNLPTSVTFQISTLT